MYSKCNILPKCMLLLNIYQMPAVERTAMHPAMPPRSHLLVLQREHSRLMMDEVTRYAVGV